MTAGYQGTFGAIVAGIRDLRSAAPRRSLADDERLDGRTVLLTGANRGLGGGIAMHLARRGARLILPTRSSPPDVDGLRAAGAADVVALDLDLASLASIDALADRLRGERIDVLVLNAGVVPRAARTTGHGLDELVAVNFLANVALTDRLLADGTLPADARVVVVSSESHRGADDYDLATLGGPERWGVSRAVSRYGRSKLMLTEWTWDLARQLPSAEVFAICPGAVASGIAREAPWWMRAGLDLVLKLTFQSPRVAAEPVAWLCCARALDGTTARYLHLHTEKPPDARALDPSRGAALRERARAVIEEAR